MDVKTAYTRTFLMLKEQPMHDESIKTAFYTWWQNVRESYQARSLRLTKQGLQMLEKIAASQNKSCVVEHVCKHLQSRYNHSTNGLAGDINAPENFETFILISAIMSLALIPILLTKRKAPTFKKITSMSIRDLYESSPLGTVGAFLLGTVHSAVFLFFAVYAAEMNFTILEISIVTFLLTISGAVAQNPVGYISDKLDRRLSLIHI